MQFDNRSLLAFYRDDAPNLQGRTHAELLSWPDERLEAVHDYIQWLFPLPEPSGANPAAPLLTPTLQAAFQSTPAMQARLRDAFLRMARFYGFSPQPNGALFPSADFPLRARVWLTAGNHNHLRITRILRSLRLAGLEQESSALFQAVAGVYGDEQRTGRERISRNTFLYWERAARQAP